MLKINTMVDQSNLIKIDIGNKLSKKLLKAKSSKIKLLKSLRT